LPVKSYSHITELYKTEYEENDGEIALCALAGLTITNIKNEEEYTKAAYYCLLMIHTAIHESDYVFPQVAITAKSRNSAGVGILGLAHHLAKNKLSWSSQEGRDEIHRVSERHYWHLLNASLKMSQEYGLANWIHKTKWPEGWLPIDTYNKNIDSIVTTDYQYDWEELRQKIIANGGIHNSVLVAHAPSESSSISTGTTNGVYPIRMLNILKGNDNDVLYYSVPDSEKLEKYYEIAYNIPTVNMKMNYGILQKFADQTTSADDWKDVKGDHKITTEELLLDFFSSVKYGNKSRYYVNTETAKGNGLETTENNSEVKIIEELLEQLEEEDADCESCKL
jgi:ribonucleoside-diphosphate reductase alpha chain